MTKLAVPLDRAQAAAADVVARLDGAVARVDVAGSIRRGKAEVGDIEIVALPVVAPYRTGLFSDITVPVDRLRERVDRLLSVGFLARHPDDPKRGERYIKCVHAASGMQLDLFMPVPEAYGLILLIRTGPADHSRRLVTEMKRMPRPHHVAGGRLHLGTGAACSEGNPHAAYPCRVVPVPQEQDVYEALGIPFVEPGDRR